MNDKTRPDHPTPKRPGDVNAAKAAAQETIGKLIGDDDAVAKARADAAATKPSPAAGRTTKE